GTRPPVHLRPNRSPDHKILITNWYVVAMPTCPLITTHQHFPNVRSEQHAHDLSMNSQLCLWIISEERGYGQVQVISTQRMADNHERTGNGLDEKNCGKKIGKNP